MSVIYKIAYLLFLSFVFLVSTGGEAVAGKYPATIEALQERYSDEINAHRKYNAYAKQACKEGYPNIAHLFKTLASSEAIHGRNFKNILKKLGAKPKADTHPIDSGSTRTNLKQAATVERDEIDTTYPTVLAKIKEENHQDAIHNITYAWKSEQQHRDLIVKLQKASSAFFGLLVKKIEGKESHFHVCQVCGSTLLEKTSEKCPICSHTGKYKEIPPLSEISCPVK
ncbi:rubrerythrin family protein [Solemya velum gill symbiont]|uniref:rubrerythrin family protein n=1 Tax=Solemya velum gill symbiont TaxID=2340 RepID=UPI000996CEE5|nr:ferritin family protein [Solemya velum gill symbiont]OOZ44746.1 hypothetical protein BOW37_05555 [Solemya velum gill symbiont]OOZ46872.1 hypothetical protein BOW38_05775 [Solemya velum gill symbiont]OOZ50575.1 hypothetical protein BOW39_02140 [Solemya velum gill symbiont]OOZ51820.1 hypothetical protein BOW40_05615 [Solemya velum gill symbiont]OOZ54362.1 hypothetical protein BOW41_06320 [Solemya velum gill symbiont]